MYNHPLNILRNSVTGAIQRGEAEPIEEIKPPTLHMGQLWKNSDDQLITIWRNADSEWTAMFIGTTKEDPFLFCDYSEHNTISTLIDDGFKPCPAEIMKHYQDVVDSVIDFEESDYYKHYLPEYSNQPEVHVYYTAHLAKFGTPPTPPHHHTA